MTSRNVPSDLPDNQASSAKILVVDDDWINRELMEAVLQTAGYHVLLANDRPAGLKLAQTEKPDLVLIDVRLSYSTEGYDLCRELRQNQATAGCKLVMLTAMESPADRALAAEAGADEYLSRMLDITDILRRIEQVLAGRSVGRTLG